MTETIYEWIQNIIIFLIFASAVLEVLPGNAYQKYIRFFVGIVLILLVTSPFLKLSGMESRLFDIYRSREYERELDEAERLEKEFAETTIFDFISEEFATGSREGISEENGRNTDAPEEGDGVTEEPVTKRIEVEEIRIGE